MNIKEYFNSVQGFGILATGDSEGKINLALYTIPHVVDETTIAFVMRDRLTHHNLQSHPYAAYMFFENVQTYSGVRLYLRKLHEEKNSPIIDSLNRQDPKIHPAGLDDTDKYLVYFLVDKVRPLEGDKNFGENMLLKE